MRPPSAARYVAVWIALLVLSAATLALSRAPLGAAGPVVALAIASAKFSLIAAFFMHLAGGRATPAAVLVTAIVLIAAFVGLTAADPATRDPAQRIAIGARAPAP